ncbi:L,D-transpeptidase family protein [Falsiroseomonas sp. CW058]|uniref:L,D-transpeptidase family protein n=1 Tax=Falsiroseomonas sp. CW058 TaxID=3388664 RepID=UPI003D31AA54
MRTARRPLIAAALALAAGPAAAQMAPVSLPAPQPPAPPADPVSALLRLVERLKRIDEDGLDPRHYAIPDASLAAADAAGWRAALHRSAQLALGDLLLGRVREMPGRPDLRRDAAAAGLDRWLAELANAPDPAAVIDRAAALPEGAAALKAELARQRAIARRGFAPIPGEATIEPGSTDALRVPALRARLAVEDAALAAAPNGGALYDAPLEAAVKRWQAQNGLEADGRVGRISLGLLNRPLQARVDQLRVALDMRRGAAAEPAERRIEVNIPDYRLSVLEEGRELLSMAVIVGRRDRATPMLRVRMTAIQFNPPWGVPERNAREDLLPRFRRDPQSMMEKGFRVFGMVDGQRQEIDPRTIDWSSVNPQRFPYFIRQDAGDANALGRIKFIMPNNDDIFMHDTPDRHLFRRPDRAFSSGCIRLERPNDLMAVLLDGTAGWDVARAQRALDARTTSAVALRRQLPVTLAYRTVVVEGARVRIRPDVYDLDAAYARVMAAPRPQQVAALAGRA